MVDVLVLEASAARRGSSSLPAPMDVVSKMYCAQTPNLGGFGSSPKRRVWKRGREVKCTALLTRRSGNRLTGSNPVASVGGLAEWLLQRS
jgi:hypothetical protein